MTYPRPIAAAASTLLLAAAAAAQVPTSVGSSPPRGAAGRFATPVSRPPNVLVILCDQLSVRMLGHEDNGFGGVVQSMTPNLDQLAQEGVRFTSAACAAAVCQPSRYTILTGRWPHSHGMRTNNIWEPLGETTFPELARAAGYETASIGKHHMMWFSQPPGMSHDHGFDTILDFGTYGTYCVANGQSSFNAPANVVAMPGLAFPLDQTGYTTNSNAFHPSGYFADQVIDFLEERAGPGGDGRPFVCWYSMIGPHTPVLPSGVPPDDWASLYQPWQQLTLPPNLSKIASTLRLAILQADFAYVTDDQFREILSYYYALISQIDFNIGRVLTALDDLGLTDDTLVLFTTDHGEMGSEMSCWSKGSGAYDAVTRVPLIVRFPGVVPAGQVVSAPVNAVDLFPTLVEASGVPIPDTVRAAVEGASFLGLMIKGMEAGWQQQSFHEIGNGIGNRQWMVRTARSKYVRDEIGSVEEFYDLVLDPWEITDLFGDPDPAIQAEIADLQARYDAWWNDEIGHAPIYPKMGATTAVPVASLKPVPTSGATGVARDVDPSWQPCTGAWTQEVFFGTDPASVPLFATLAHMESTFNPGTLAPATTYYWRVDQINANGITAGPVWTFTTAAGGSGGPALAAAPSPAHRAEGVALGTTLSWTVGPGTVTQDVWFGEAGALQLAAAGLGAGTATWSPPPLSAGVAYAWRVDGTDPAGTTEGDVWTFTTSPAGLAQRAVGVHPLHLEADVPAGAVLEWIPGAGVLSHDVYFGTGFPLPFQGNQTAVKWSPGPLVSGQVYYWRIDEVNAFGTTVGWTWRFTAE